MPKPPPLRAARLLSGAALAAALLGAPCAGAETPAQAEDGVAFEGTWSAAGQRQVLEAGEREAAATRLSGAFTVLRGEGLRKGFRGEGLFYTNGRDIHVGTLVLTDDRGDRVYCDLDGEATAKGAAISATIRGGSGAYEGISGSFSFRWRQLVKAPDGEVQGLAEDLKGRFRLKGAGARR